MLTNNQYIATFHSHFGALTYCKALQKQGISAKLKPVPRKVSASCGTCVYYEHSAPIDLELCELDCVYIESGETLECAVRK